MATFKAIFLMIFAVAGAALVVSTVGSEVSTNYNTSFIEANQTSAMATLTEESHIAAAKMESTQASLQKLGTGDLVGFVFTLPSQIGAILSLFIVDIPNMFHAVFSSIISAFGLPAELAFIVYAMILVIVVFVVLSIWTRSEV